MFDQPRGAYGLRLGPPVDYSYLVEAAPSWPVWQMRWEKLLPGSEKVPQRISASDAFIDLVPEGRAHIYRDEAASTLYLPSEPKPEAWVHPHLSSTAAVVARWFGRWSFHAGGFVLAGKAWAVLGGRGDGKTSMLAWLTTHGYPILCDDVLVVDREQALAGPRCIDLRHGAALHFGIGEYIGQVGTRKRWRAQLGPVAHSVPLAGWVSPAWGPSLELTPVKTAERLPLLLASRGLRLPEPDREGWLGLVAKPMVRFRRQQDWAALDSTMSELIGVLASRSS